MLTPTLIYSLRYLILGSKYVLLSIDLARLLRKVDARGAVDANVSALKGLA